MVAVSKLSQISPGTPQAVTDQIVGVIGGTTDALYSIGDIGRVPATGNLTFYVATTGSDSNPGTISQPFATIQHAVDVATQFNYQGQFTPTINVADGTYLISAVIGLPFLTNCPGTAMITGDNTTPGNVIVHNNVSGGVFSFVGPQIWFISGFQSDCTGFGSHISAAENANVGIDCWNFADSAAGGKTICLTAGSQAAIGYFGSLGALTLLASSYEAFMHALQAQSVAIQSGSIVFPVSCAFSPFWFANGGLNNYFQMSPTNLGGVTGNSVFLVAGAILYTDNGLLSDIPGNGLASFIDQTVWIVNNNSSQGQQFFYQNVGIPVAADVQEGTYLVVKDTSGGGLYLIANDGGTIKKVALT